MKIRELLVAIKVTVQDAGAKKLADALDGIVKFAPKVNESLASTERAAAKAAREQEKSARKAEAAKKSEAREAERAARKIESAAKSEAAAATKAAREIERAAIKAAGAKGKEAKDAERAAAKVARAMRVEQRAAEKAARAIEKAEKDKVRAVEQAARKVERAKQAEVHAYEKQMAAIKRANDRSVSNIRSLSASNQEKFEGLQQTRKTQHKEARAEVGGAFGDAAGSLATGAGMFVGGLAAAGGFALSKAGDMESLRARLKVLEGDETKAAETFARIKSLAKGLPSTVEEVTSALVGLRSQGLQATDAALTAHSDMAASAGKSILDWTEAVKDATTGERERLKEFGVTAKDMGTKVAFTFKGQTTEVEKNQKAIEDYLISLGQVEGVAGASAAQMGTLAGGISNFTDAFTNAIDEAMQSSGALDEAKGLLGDLAGGADGAAMAFGTVLADALKTARTFLKNLTAEDIQAWFDRAVDAGLAMIDMISGAVSMFMDLVDAAGSLSEKMDLSAESITTITLALGALLLAGGGLPGLFAATAVAAAGMGSALADAYADVTGLTDEMWALDQSIKEHQANIEWLDARMAKEQAARDKENAIVDALMARGLSYSDAKDQAVRGQVARIDFRRDRADQRFQDIAKANQAGFGEELFATAAEQAKGLETGNRPGASQDLTDEQKAIAVAGGNAGLSQKGVQAKARIAAAKAKALADTKKAGGDVEARTAGLAANEVKARKAFTDAIRAGKSDEDAYIAAENALLGTKTKKGGKGGKKKDKQQDILEQLGLKGPGSILENRPSPQSLTISTVVTIKLADKIEIPITMPAGATFETTAQEAGQQLGEVASARAMEIVRPVIEEILALKHEQLAKRRGGGRVPRTAKKGGAG